MKVITSNPVYFTDKQKVSSANGQSEQAVFPTTRVFLNADLIGSEYFTNADGDTYLPFDGQTELETFLDETGERFYMSFNGEDFYNAKGDKVKGAFKKMGRGVVKVGKAIGRGIKKVGRFFVKASKKVVAGVKKIPGKAKAGKEKLVHQRKERKDKRSFDKALKQGTKKQDYEARQQAIANAKAKGQTPPPPLPPPIPEQPEGAGGSEDVFTKPLQPPTDQTPKEKIVEVEGKKYSTEGIEDNKEVVVSTDQEGNKVVGVEYTPDQVVAVTGKDGNVEYHKPDDVKPGMSKGLKIGLIVGGVVVLGVILYFALRKKGTPATSVTVAK